MKSSSNKLMALLLSLLVMFSPLNSTLASITGASGSVPVHEMMYANDDKVTSFQSNISDDCSHCQSGQCNISTICHAGNCSHLMAALTVNPPLLSDRKNSVLDLVNKHLTSVSPESLYRPPQH